MIDSLIVDVLVAVLLVITIAYCALVHRRLGALRSAQGEMTDMIDRFNQSTQRAEAAISGLRAVSEEVSRQIDPKIDEARMLRDDMMMLVERGERTAERLERAIGLGRTAAAAAESKEEAPAKGTAVASREVGKAAPPRRSLREVELINALKAVRQ